MIEFFDDIFTNDELVYLKSRMPNQIQTIQNVPDLATWMFQKCLPYLQTVDPTIHKTYPYVTFSRHTQAFCRHVDLRKDDERYKVGIYLNDITKGGTIFYKEDKEIPILHKKGRVIIFDTSLPHAGEPLLRGETKYMIGFRVK